MAHSFISSEIKLIAKDATNKSKDWICLKPHRQKASSKVKGQQCLFDSTMTRLYAPRWYCKRPRRWYIVLAPDRWFWTSLQVSRYARTFSPPSAVSRSFKESFLASCAETIERYLLNCKIQLLHNHMIALNLSEGSREKNIWIQR